MKFNRKKFEDLLEEKINELPRSRKIQDAVEGGKRIRPKLAVLFSDYYGVEEKAAYDIAVAIELGHTYSLMFDDVHDNDDDRRGEQSFCAKYGEDEATNLGSMVLLKSTKVMPDKVEDDAIENFIRCLTGQQIDIEGGINKSQYMESCRLRAGLAFMQCAELPRKYAGEEEVFECLGDCGTAAQLLDDLHDREEDEVNILDYYEEEEIKKKIDENFERALEEVKSKNVEKVEEYFEEMMDRGWFNHTI